MSKIYFVMPAYNEAENIEDTIKQWYPIVERSGKDCRLVIANDGSKDDTFSIMDSLRSQYPQFEPLNKQNSGHGATVLYLYRYAMEHGADYIFQTDSDGQTMPDEFDGFWQMRHGYKGIFGHRVVRGDGKSRAFVEKVVCFLIKCYFHVKVPDANAPFRLMDAKTVAKYLPRLDKDYNLPNIMMTTYFAYYKEEMVFKQVTFRPRQGGKNSINIRKIVKIGWKALKDFRDLKKAM